jgi:hypothetical protein
MHIDHDHQFSNYFAHFSAPKSLSFYPIVIYQYHKMYQNKSLYFFIEV